MKGSICFKEIHKVLKEIYSEVVLIGWKLLLKG